MNKDSSFEAWFDDFHIEQMPNYQTIRDFSFAAWQASRQSLEGQEPVAVRYRYANNPHKWLHSGINDTIATGYIEIQNLFTTPQPNALVEALEFLARHDWDSEDCPVYPDDAIPAITWLINKVNTYAQNAIATHQSNKGD